MYGVCKDEGCVFKPIKYQIVFFLITRLQVPLSNWSVSGSWFLDWMASVWNVAMMIIANHTERHTTMIV